MQPDSGNPTEGIRGNKCPCSLSSLPPISWRCSPVVKAEGKCTVEAVPQVSLPGRCRAAWRRWGADPEARRGPVPTPLLPSGGVWTSHSTFLGLSFLLCKKDGECVPNLKFSDEFKNSSLEPRMHWLAASTWFLSVGKENTKSRPPRSQTPWTSIPETLDI